MSKNKKLTPKEKARIEKIISYLENSSEVDELEKLLGERLTTEDFSIISRELRIRKKSYGDSIRAYDKGGESNIVIEYRGNLGKLRIVSSNFQKAKSKKEKMSFKKPDNKKQKKTIITEKERKQQLIREIELIDYNCSEEAEVLFAEYKNSKNYAHKIQLLERLRAIYMENTLSIFQYKKESLENIYEIVANAEHLGKKLKKNKKRLYDLLNNKEYTPLKQKLYDLSTIYRKSNHMLKDLQTLIVLEQNDMKAMTPIEFSSEDLKEIREYATTTAPVPLEFQKVLNALISGKYLRKYGSTIQCSEIPELRNLFAQLEGLNKEELTELSVLAIDVIKNKRKGIRKGTNDDEKKFLKTVEKKFEAIKPIPVYVSEEDTTAYYNIIDSLTEDDRNFGYISKLLQEIDSFKHARKETINKENKSKEKEHILLLLTDRFIHNYKLKLVNQGFTYVEPTFYKEVMKLYFDEQASITEEEAVKILFRLEEFEEYAIEKRYQSTSNVLKDIEEIKNKLNGYQQEKPVEPKTARNIKEELKEMSPYIHIEASRRNKELGYPEYIPSETMKTFMFEKNPNYAFSISYTEAGDTSFSIHLLDNRSLVNMDEEAIRQLKEGNNILPVFTTKQKYPTLSFTYKIKDNKLGSLSISPANIKVDSVIGENELDNYKMNPTLQEFYRVAYKLNEKQDSPENIYQQKGIITLVQKCLSKDIGSKLESAHIPFIYKKSLDEAEDLIRINHNKTCCDLFNIPKQEAHHIFNILDEQADSYYITHRGEDGKIETNGNTYLGLYLLDTLYKVNNIRNDWGAQYDPDQAAKDVLDIVTELNKNNKYTPEQIEKENDKNIKRTVKAYKKK